MQEVLVKIRYIERGLSKSLKKFPLMDKVKGDLKLLSSCSSVYKNKLTKISLLLMYYLTKFHGVIDEKHDSINKSIKAFDKNHLS